MLLCFAVPLIMPPPIVNVNVWKGGSLVYMEGPGVEDKLYTVDKISYLI